MRDKIYLIEKIDFDNMENHIALALHKKIIGYVESIDKAEAIIGQFNITSNKYKSWEMVGQEYYPKFNIIPVSYID
jgi:hypothetical protein